MTQPQHRNRSPRKYRYGCQMMTRAEVQAIREAHFAGVNVLALELQEACRVLSRRRSKKTRLPALNAVQRERVNGVLLWNLGRALGRIEQRKAA